MIMTPRRWLWVVYACLWWAVACAPIQPVPAPADPVEPRQTLQILLVDADTKRGLVGRVTMDERPVPIERDTDGSGFVEFNLVPGPRGFTACAPQHDCARFEGVDNSLLDGGATIRVVRVALRSSRVVLPQLVAEGQFLRPRLGPDRFTAIEATDFNLLHRFLDGEAIEPILQQRANAGFNILRVFTAYRIGDGVAENSIGTLIPDQYADFYARIPAFLDALSRYRLYAELVGFTGPYQGVLDSAQAMVTHWERLCGAAQQRPNVLLELVNEYDNLPNRGIPLDRLGSCPGVLTSHGSAIQDSLPLLPVWDYVTFHPGPGLSGEWARRVGHETMEMANRLQVPVIANETIRFPDHVASVTGAYDAAAGASLLVAGSAFHSVGGKRSRLWNADPATSRLAPAAAS